MWYLHRLEIIVLTLVQTGNILKRNNTEYYKVCTLGEFANKIAEIRWYTNIVILLISMSSRSRILQVCTWIVFLLDLTIWVRRVWRYQRSNQNPYIEEKQTTQWPKEKVQKDKQRSTKHTHKTKDRVTRTPLKTEGELRCSGTVSSSCSTSGTRRVILLENRN